MANPPIGTNIWEGPLGVVQLTFNSVNLGKTMEDTTIEPIEDLKDILYQQDGTQPADKIPTGQAFMVTGTFGVITIALLKELQRGFTQSGGSGDSAKLGRDLYRSGLANFSKQLLIERVDSDGVISTDPRHRLTMYKAMPIINSPIEWGAATQRGVQFQFYCFFDDTNLAFGFSGFASSLGL